jgi:hypothetical protein
MGTYGHFIYTDRTYTDNDGYQEYLVESITATDYILDQTVEIDTGAAVTIDDSGIYIVDWYNEDNNRQVIRDTTGGQIRFADGTTQDTTAQDIPQINVEGDQYKLGMKDRGRHLYFTQEGTVVVPYHESVPLPIGTTVTVINNSGNTIYINAEGGASVTLIYPPNGTGGAAYLDDHGLITLIKVEYDTWFLTGGPGGWD